MVAGGLAIACATLAFAAFRRTPDHVADFDQLWYAARALGAGGNPYAVVGPGRAFDFPWLLYYPLPALLVVMPLVALPLLVARVVLVGLGAGVLAFAVTREGWRPLLIFTSAAYIVSLTQVQFAPLFVAALFLPVMGTLLVAKPNLGACIAVSPLSWRLAVASLGGAAVLVAGSFAVMPTWHRAWLAVVADAPHIRPYVLRPGGVLVLAALLRWRRPEARLLAALAVVPQNATLYDTLPLFVIPATLNEAAILSIASHGAWHLAIARRGDPTSLEIANANALTYLLVLYLPALVMVLRRPNVGSVPAWLERLAACLPSRVRGRVGTGDHTDVEAR
jgi:SAM-dependent methyltransferase